MFLRFRAAHSFLFEGSYAAEADRSMHIVSLLHISFCISSAIHAGGQMVASIPPIASFNFFLWGAQNGKESPPDPSFNPQPQPPAPATSSEPFGNSIAYDSPFRVEFGNTGVALFDKGLLTVDLITDDITAVASGDSSDLL